MKVWKKAVLFYLGGSAYMFLEFLWRGRSHGSMFLLGGTCFLALGKVFRLRLPLWGKTLLGSFAVTALELLTGIALNRQYHIWDYRQQPLNFRGQICLCYSLLWMPVCLFGMWLHEKARNYLEK